MTHSREYPAIAPVPEGTQRPFWSVMIPTYNCADYLVDTLKSVLQQDPGPETMQIEVVDDYSTKDDPEAVVKDLGKGRVSFYRQPQNSGAPANFTTCVQRSRGHWVHILHGDDMVMPGFYEAYRQPIEAHACSMVVGQALLVNEQGEQIGVSNALAASNGLLDDALMVLAKENPVVTPTVVVARQAYKKVGGFNPSLVHSNDWEMWTRLAAVGSVGYVLKPYALYRKHSASDTNKLARSAVQVTDSLKALKTIQAQVKDAKAQKEIQACVYQRKSTGAYYKSRTFADHGNLQPALLNAYWALRLKPSVQTLTNMGYVTVIGGKNSLTRRHNGR